MLFLKDKETTVDDDVKHYEKLDIDEVNRQLREHGIDPEKTVAEVLKLVNQSRQQQRAKRRG